MTRRYPSAKAIAHLTNIAKLAGLEIVDIRPEVDSTDAEVWCSVSGSLGGERAYPMLCGLLARRNSAGGTLYGTTGTKAEQDTMCALLKSKKHIRIHMLGDNLLDALCDGPV